MAEQNGGITFVYDGTDPIGSSTNCTLTVNGKEIPTSNKDEAGWETHIQGKKNWEISVEGFYDPADTVSFDTLLDKLIALTQVNVKYSSGVSSTRKYEGTASIMSVVRTDNDDEAAGCSFTLKGTGALTPGTEA